MRTITFFLLSILNFSFAQDFIQRVEYKIDAELFPASRSLKVKSLMTYQNNSPDQLNDIYIHIYWNIYSKNSYARKLAESQKVYYSQETRDVEIKKVTLLQSGKTLDGTYDLDNTVMRIPLIEPLKPGETLKVEIELDEEIPPEGLRMGYYQRYFSIAHWFPSVCAYDKFGWHKDQYLGTGEFYEEISDFEVNLILPETFLVFYTGELLNPKEVYNESILSKLEQAKKSDTTIRIFEPSNKIRIDDEKKKVWKFKAQSVRTFAFACFEDYLWDASSVNGILVNTVYPKQLENFYTNEGMKAARHAIKFFSEKIGPYVYPQMFVTVGGSSGGMEYPGIVFMGRGQVGGILSYSTASIIIHEIGHNWFPMMLNSNEVEYAFMDEGFNTFFTNLAVEDLYGRYNNSLKLGKTLSKIFFNSDVRTNDYSEVVQYLKSGYTEPIITHSDRYEQTQAYNVNSYPRTSMNLFMLQYVMGEKAFDELWKEYYKRFLFKKIYPEDFFNLAEEIDQKYNGRKSLRWFFNEWFYKDYTLDFSLDKFKVEKTNESYHTTIKVRNKGRALMPCDVELTFEDGSKEKVYFEVDDFSKGIQLATKSFKFEKKPIKAEINPDKRLLDINRLNNASDFISPVSLQWKPIVDLFTNPFRYQLFFSPTYWFNNVDGLKIGFNINGSYLRDEKVIELNLLKGLREKHSFGGEVKISDRIYFLGPDAFGSLRIFNYEGRRGSELLFEKTFSRYYGRNPQFKLKLSANYFDAFDDRYFDKYKFDTRNLIISPYDYYIEEFYSQRKFLFTTAEFSYINNWQYLKTSFNLYYEAGTVIENYSRISYRPYSLIQSRNNVLYQKLSFAFIQDIRPKSIVTNLKLREYVGVTPKKLPETKEFYLATVNPIDEFSLPLYRTYGFFSRNFISNHSIPNGDGMMRGYYKNNLSDDLITTFNGEINFTKTFSYLGFPGKVIAFFNPKFFFDFGNVWANEKEFNWKALKSDWGISISMLPDIDERITSQLNKLNPLIKLGINDFRIDFPLYVSHPPVGEKKFEFRWLIGLRQVF